MCWSEIGIQMLVLMHNLLLIVCLQGISMIIGGIKHREQRFNSRSAGVSSALLFISIGGIYGSCTQNFFKLLNNMSSTHRFINA